VGKDYRIGLIVGSVLVAFALLWVATRPGLTPQPQPVPSGRDGRPRPAQPDNRVILPGTSELSKTGKLSPNEPARAARGGSPGPTTRDANAPAPVTRVHIVRPGETLSAIAQQYYGSPNAWRKILDANKTLKDANKLTPGTKLIVPE